jgi:hypothetical protein
VSPAPARWLGHPLWLLKRRRWAPPGAWAAPPPRPARTGASPRRHQALACDGRRARPYCSGAEQSRQAALPASRQGGGNRNTGVGQPHGWAPASSTHVRTPARRPRAPGTGKRQQGKKPLRGGGCLLPKGVLLRVRRSVGLRLVVRYNHVLEHRTIAGQHAHNWASSCASCPGRRGLGLAVPGPSQSAPATASGEAPQAIQTIS